ncbi:hypothetical protein C5167_010913 [Papaver somniferum]|uniref:Uncharacterized protein n=1 Tax=Papaver somniferum TaxID=3469 RepID=A0A4Y7K1J3_PAPSO|nr:hypothetical protein C5167_010913 [Papaver somniferum]
MLIGFAGISKALEKLKKLRKKTSLGVFESKKDFQIQLNLSGGSRGDVGVVMLLKLVSVKVLSWWRSDLRK